jgi:hypothetical protein
MSNSDKKRMSVDNMRVGKNYRIINYGDTTGFTVLATDGHNDFKIKDLLSLEVFRFGDLIQYGIGPDFELFEI